jgi:predicted ATPase/class 3 adenylate cyclase
MADIFISHAHATAQGARAAAAALRAAGYSVWIDDDLLVHRAFGKEIETQLTMAKAALVIWSAEAAESDWVLSEANRAREARKLVQLTFDGARLPMPFDQIQCADLSGWTGDTSHPGWTRVLGSLAELAGTRTAEPEAPAREAGLMAVLAAEIEGIGLLRLNHHVALEQALTTGVADFRAGIEAQGGHVFRQADALMMAVFTEPEAAIAAAVQAQQGLAGRTWPGVGAINVRMAVHFGAVEPRGADYFGPALNRVSRLLTLAQGGQILATGALADLLPGRFSFKPLGAHALEDPLTQVSLFQVLAEGLKDDFAPIAVEQARPVGNLPARQRSLIGRESDLTQIGALFETNKLVTVTGTGGVGKTRIALEYAHQRQGQHEDGVWLVELASIADAAQVTGAIAAVFGLTLPPFGDPVQALVDRLRPRDCLIVLDNCEHVLDAVAAVAEATLEQAPRVKLLASSQEAIGLEGEQVFRLRSLGEPDAVTLFTERAKAADAGFAIKDRDGEAVTAICQRLDGIPLAIEMAAARAPTLGCEALLQHLDDRFRILTGGRRTALPRQRTLAAALDWSHGLLSAEDAAVFRRLGVFTGGFTLEAASSVAAHETTDAVDVIGALSSLVAKSLVVADTLDNRTRYRLLETTRMYALERMAEAGETCVVQRRHAEYFSALVERAGPDYYALTDTAYHARYAPEVDNIERALDWGFGPDGDTKLALLLTAGSWPAYSGASKTAAYMPWSDLALSRITSETTPDVALRVRRSAVDANAWTRMAPVPAMAKQILPELRAQNNPGVLGDLLAHLAHALLLLGRHGEAVAAHSELEALVAPLPTTRLTIATLRLAAMLAFEDGRVSTAVDLCEKGVAMANAIGADGWANWLSIERALDREMPAEAAIGRLRDLLARIRPEHMFSAFNTVQATYALIQRLAQRNAPGDVDEAYALARATEKWFGRTVPGFAGGAILLLALADGRPADAARLYGFGEAMRVAMGINTRLALEGAKEGRAALLEHLSEPDLARLMAEGARMTEEQNFLLATKQVG